MLTLIIPAYNEAENIEAVLDVVVTMPDFQQIVVIDDGSVDGTYDKIKQYPVESIRFDHNRGKGAAIWAGVQFAQHPYIMLLDADLIGLREEHLRSLIEPVVHGDAAMSLGLFGTGRFATDWAQRVAPNLSGQRVLRREVLESLPMLEDARYGVEVALTRHVRHAGLKVAEVPLSELTHRMKEEKLGLVPGFMARMRMYWDIMRVLIR
ncbi:glycosyl transferase family 2 [Tumebacillus sp. BK434]|uniref:glycosyltransferase family 2 protein n=1 Tax=Tumebacillus sp. BK434 TaxID=2512169 RepID=UPI00104C748B|nr:glycosyltransferase family 2 protein [Tumebacillus sp. BK434]TCP58865.1 glycosyl transferase family 2 [Tumebacillus sp. BK434]